MAIPTRLPRVPGIIEEVNVPAPPQPDERQGILQRIGGLLARGLQGYGGLFAGEADPTLTDAQNQNARRRALLASAAALAGQRGFEAIPRAMLLGHEVADSARQDSVQRAEEQQRKERLEGLLGGGMGEEQIRGLLGEAIRSGDTGMAQVARGLLADMQPEPLSAIRAGNDTVLIDPRTGEERGRFAGQPNIERTQVGDYIVWRNADNPSEIIHREYNPTNLLTPAQARQERNQERAELLGQAENLASLMVQHGSWGETGPDPQTILAQVRGNFPDLNPIEAGEIVRSAINRQRAWELQQGGRELTNTQREQRLSGGAGVVNPEVIQSAIQAGRAQGLTDEQIIARAPEGFRPLFQQAIAEQQGGDPAGGGDFGAFADLIPQ